MPALKGFHGQSSLGCPHRDYPYGVWRRQAERKSLAHAPGKQPAPPLRAHLRSPCLPVFLLPEVYQFPVNPRHVSQVCHRESVNADRATHSPCLTDSTSHLSASFLCSESCTSGYRVTHVPHRRGSFPEGASKPDKAQHVSEGLLTLHAWIGILPIWLSRA